MPIFNYQALKNGKDTISGKVDAVDIKEAREHLRKLSLLPIKIIEQVEKTPSLKSATSKKTNLKKLKMRDKIDFVNTLHILSKTGIPLIEALLFIQNHTTSKDIKKVAEELRKDIIGGANLADAVAKHPTVFDSIFAGLVKAGEESGELDLTLERMSFLLDKQDKYSSKVKMTMLYPCFVIIIATFVTLVMLTFVFPAFKEMYDGMGKSLPLITKVLMDLGVFLKQYWIVIPIIIGSFIYSAYFLFTWEASRRKIDSLSMKLPILNQFIQYVSLSNFIAVLKVAFDAGVPIVDCIMLANNTAQNYIIRDQMKNAALKIQHGQSISTALEASGVIPGIIMCMIATGEQSGQLGDMLEICTTYIDTQLERVTDALTKLFEPLLLIIIGGIVLTLALALYLPLFQTYSNIV